MLDGYLNPPAVALMYGHGSVLDYFTDLRMGPSARIVVVANSWLTSLTAEQRHIFEEAVKAGRRANRQWNSNARTRERAEMEKAGIQWIKPSTAERAEWAAKTLKFPSKKWFDATKTTQVDLWIEQSKETAAIEETKP